MSEPSIAVSFIVPCRNEERFLGATLDAIRRCTIQGTGFEVVVADHGSTDRSCEIAKARGARIVAHPAGTIAALRNAGVRGSAGRILVFLDADVTIAESWWSAFESVRQELERAPLTVTGSKCSSPATAGWIARAWSYQARGDREVSHIGSGHLITTRALFEQLGGFDEALETGEDYDFSTRARRLGARLVSTPSLHAVHHGVPDTLAKFFARERWHGVGDWISTSSWLASPVALAAAGFVGLHVLLLVGMAVVSPWWLVPIVTALALLISIGGLAWKKSRGAGVAILMGNMVLYYVYFWARTFSPVYKVLQKSTLHGSPRAGRAERNPR